MTSDTATRFFPARAENLTADDFETASVHSAAPSYVSEAPSYHSTVPNSEAVPAYAPSARTEPATTQDSSDSSDPGTTSSRQTQARPIGLPPVPDRPLAIPSLSAFAIPTWSNVFPNPNARLYQSVAQRRVAAANSRVTEMRHYMLERVIEEEEERAQIRPLEDPYLVGEEAAARARSARLARERGGHILLVEDRRWDWFIGQTRDWEERDRNWANFRREIGGGQRQKLARRLGNLSSGFGRS